MINMSGDSTFVVKLLHTDPVFMRLLDRRLTSLCWVERLESPQKLYSFQKPVIVTNQSQNMEIM